MFVTINNHERKINSVKNLFPFEIQSHHLYILIFSRIWSSLAPVTSSIYKKKLKKKGKKRTSQQSLDVNIYITETAVAI